MGSVRSDLKNSTPSPLKHRKTTSYAIFCATGTWGLSFDYFFTRRRSYISFNISRWDTAVRDIKTVNADDTIFGFGVATMWKPSWLILIDTNWATNICFKLFSFVILNGSKSYFKAKLNIALWINPYRIRGVTLPIIIYWKIARSTKLSLPIFIDVTPTPGFPDLKKCKINIDLIKYFIWDIKIRRENSTFFQKLFLECLRNAKCQYNKMCVAMNINPYAPVAQKKCGSALTHH